MVSVWFTYLMRAVSYESLTAISSAANACLQNIPPLEDMTEVLKQASAIRAGMLDTVTNDQPQVKTSNAKDRAKVKKNVAAKVVNPKNVTIDETAGDHKTRSTTTSVTPSPQTTPVTPSPQTAPVTPSPQTASVIPSPQTASVIPSPQTATQPSSLPTKAVITSSGGNFGGLKKGFLFGGTSKSSSNSNRKNTESVKPMEINEEKSESKPEKDDMPFITPKIGKTESGLTIDEVQKAMTEAKGLLDNQDWINDDLLNKVEKNELLLKRFADPHFMKALNEFQTNPTAAMEKYKGNQEVEKFLMEFCGLLGDHFTNIGNPSDNGAESKTSSNTQSNQPKNASKISELSAKQTQPKIVELVDKKLESAEFNDLHEPNIEGITKKCPKIIELADKDKSLGSPPELQALETKSSRKDIIVHSSSEEADIKELPASEDDKFKEMLNDPRVMEILLDPQIMNLIHQLKSDPEIAQRTIDTADGNLKDKIKFLVSRGLLQFENC